jgi:succinoglycan biosynthesis transport protein ExoP
MPLQHEPQGPAPQPEPEFDLNVGEYVGMVRRHWKLIVVLCALSLAASLTHYAITPKVYTAEAQIQIKRKSLSPLVNTQNPWMDAYNVEFFPTQYELLRSRGLAERVVRNLDLMADAGVAAAGAERRKPSAAEDQAVLGGLAEGLRSGLAVEPIRNTELVKLYYRHSSPTFAAKAANGFAEAFIDMGVEDRYTVAGKASTFLGSQIEALKKEIDQKETQLQALSRKSDLVAVGEEGSSNVNMQRLEALNASYIEAKRNRIDKQSAYQELMTEARETVADSLGGGIVSDLRAEQLRLERDYETKLKTYKPEWPAMQELQAQIQKGREHLESVMQEMFGKAQKSSYAAFQTALRQEQSLESEMARAKGTVMDQSSDSVIFSNLKVEIETRRSLLNDLLRKQSETEVTARLQDTRDSNVTIVDRALVPGAPSFPSLRKSGSSGLLVGLLASAALILLIEFLDRTIKTPEEVERRLALPTLAVIPDISEGGRSYGYGYGLRRSEARARKKPASRVPSVSWLERKKGTPDADQIELTPHQNPRSPVAEAYRELRTGLLLSTAAELRVIAITSAASGEGKTATSTNLAVVLAQLGRRVLLVDGDLRKPRLHQVFHVSNRVGLVNQLTGTAEPDAVVLKTEIPNLWVTPSGPIPPNPSELLSSPRMRDWIEAAKEHFDIVILDTPPTLAVTDGTILGAMADGVLLTLRAGKVTREDARACRDRLQFAGVRVLGVALNRYRAMQGLGKGYRYYEAYGAYENKPANPQTGSAA